MKVSSRGEYGLRAMVTFAYSFGDGPRSIASVSKQSGVPAAYLEQLIAPLRNAGLVESKRGAHGGYQLTRPPEMIRVGEIYRALEGPVAPMDCVSEDESEQTCPLIEGCETRPVWLSMKEAIVATIDGITLADLLRKERPKATVTASVSAGSGAAVPS